MLEGRRWKRYKWRCGEQKKRRDQNNREWEHSSKQIYISPWCFFTI